MNGQINSLIRNTQRHQCCIYPRSGYVPFLEYKSQRWKPLLGIAIAVFILLTILTVAVYFGFEVALRWLSLLMGSFIGLTLLWEGARLRLLSFLLLGIYSILIGVLFGLLAFILEGTGRYPGLLYYGVYLMLFGIGAISGTVRFWRYLTNPRFEEASHDG